NCSRRSVDLAETCAWLSGPGSGRARCRRGRSRWRRAGRRRPRARTPSRRRPRRSWRPASPPCPARTTRPPARSCPAARRPAPARCAGPRRRSRRSTASRSGVRCRAAPRRPAWPSPGRTRDAARSGCRRWSWSLRWSWAAPARCFGQAQLVVRPGPPTSVVTTDRRHGPCSVVAPGAYGEKYGKLGPVLTDVEISPREAEVLELVGAHLSNAEIAARLFISVRTVESHVSSLLRKLQLPDRRALARRAPQRTPYEPHPALPTPLTSFIGRASEQADLSALIRNHRQVSAVGAGGVGKTRLALAVAAATAGEYADGVRFADIVPVTDPGLVATAVAGAVGLSERPGTDLTASGVAARAGRRALLVLDNSEHVLDGVALFVERLLKDCPRLTVLATSRARLMVPFERVYAVPPLSVDADAVALFMERAAAVGSPLDPASSDRIAAVCERLDGMALAIELAAARCATLGLDGITAALSHPLRMLTGGSRADERHRSVRGALDWSHALLEPHDRELLRRVSVFVAPFTATAAAGVTGGEEGIVAEGLARLAEQSLLAVTPSPLGTEYRALETIRQYGLERLTEAKELDDTRTRHARWCLTQATTPTTSEGCRPGFDAA